MIADLGIVAVMIRLSLGDGKRHAKNVAICKLVVQEKVFV